MTHQQTKGLRLFRCTVSFERGANLLYAYKSIYNNLLSYLAVLKFTEYN